MIKTEVVSLDQVRSEGVCNHTCKNEVFHGVVDSYECRWSVECEKNGVIDYCSVTMTNDYEYIRVPEVDDDWNQLGISVSLAEQNGWKATGRIVFRGYCTSYYDADERDWFVEDASEEVEKL